MSSMCPTIVTGSNAEVRVIIGASGGTRITTGVAYVSIYGNQRIQDRLYSGTMLGRLVLNNR